MANIKESLRNSCQFLSENKYAIYVLTILMLAYMINQCDTFCLIATNTNMAQDIGYGDRQCSSANDTAVYDFLERNISGLNMTADNFCHENTELCDEETEWLGEQLCYWQYLGKGLEYQLLAGPLYIVLFSISGIPMGLIAELKNINRKLILFLCVVLWSAMTIFGGLCKEYWQVAVTRLLLGIFSAGAVPFSASIISDYFTPETRGAALGFYNWGIYVGYSLTFLLVIAERELGWENVYYIAGAPGVLIGILIIATIKEPSREIAAGEKAVLQIRGTLGKLKQALLHFVDPAMLLLCLGGAIRNGAGIVFAYNIIIFFEEYHPEVKTEEWMSWIPLVFGSIGAFGGGFVSDKLASKKGIVGRLMVLIGCLVLSAPLLVGTLYAPMPYLWVCHIFAYMIGEMWIGVCVAVVIDLVPADLTTSSVAVYFFIIQIIGGNMNLLVPPIEKRIGLRLALIVTFPGMYIAGAIFFVLTLVVVLHKKGKDGYLAGQTGEKKNDDDFSSIRSSHGHEDDDDVYTKSDDLLEAHDVLGIRYNIEDDILPGENTRL